MIKRYTSYAIYYIIRKHLGQHLIYKLFARFQYFVYTKTMSFFIVFCKTPPPQGNNARFLKNDAKRKYKNGLLSLQYRVYDFKISIAYSIFRVRFFLISIPPRQNALLFAATACSVMRFCITAAKCAKFALICLFLSVLYLLLFKFYFLSLFCLSFLQSFVGFTEILNRSFYAYYKIFIFLKV